MHGWKHPHRQVGRGRFKKGRGTAIGPFNKPKPRAITWMEVHDHLWLGPNKVVVSGSCVRVESGPHFGQGRPLVAKRAARNRAALTRRFAFTPNQDVILGRHRAGCDRVHIEATPRKAGVVFAGSGIGPVNCTARPAWPPNVRLWHRRRPSVVLPEVAMLLHAAPRGALWLGATKPSRSV